MKTGYITLKGATCQHDKAQRARVNFDYANDDVVVICTDGTPTAIYTLGGAKVELNDPTVVTLEDALAKLIAKA